jgi:hypothetical protein
MTHAVHRNLSGEQRQIQALLQRSGHTAVILTGCILGIAGLYFLLLFVMAQS